ncbi:MAG: hypothetical protein Q7V48_10975 [Deltaproteobacteria bacterium]|nr:hypothetical protein [Deltaproteobacteria bacterium]
MLKGMSAGRVIATSYFRQLFEVQTGIRPGGPTIADLLQHC